MSVANSFKADLIDKISALSGVQKVYGWEHNNPEGWPAVMVVNTGIEGEFFSTAENRRIYAFRVIVMMPIGKDLATAPSDRVQEAERIVNDVMESIINAVDTDYTFSGAPAVLWVDAVDSESSYLGFDGGWAKAAMLTIRFHTDFTV